MITANKLKVLTDIGPKGLVVFLERSGFKNRSFKTATFLGLTNSGQFCYSVTDPEDNVSKVFVTYDSATDRITADC